MKEPKVGDPIFLFLGGDPKPLSGTIASVAEDGSLAVGYLDSRGNAMQRMGLRLAQNAEEGVGGDYAIAADGTTPDAAEQAHAAAFQKTQPAAMVEGKATEPTAPGSEFSSAAHSSRNIMPAGSGGPFDPANTSLAHMSEHQRDEGRTPGLPTTGGVTPKLDVNNPHLSERDREALSAMQATQDPDEKARIANAGTGAVTPGNAEQLAAAQDKAAKGPTPAAAAKTAKASAKTAPAPRVVNAEADRTAREAAAEKESVRVSAERKAERRAAPAKKAPAKKVAAKAPAKKTRR